MWFVGFLYGGLTTAVIEVAIIVCYVGLYLICVLLSLEVDKMKMSNKTYDILKWIAQYLLPASGTLYFAIASIWNLPYGEQIVGTITAVDAFLGVILGISTANYNKEGAE